MKSECLTIILHAPHHRFYLPHHLVFVDQTTHVDTSTIGIHRQEENLLFGQFFYLGNFCPDSIFIVVKNIYHRYSFHALQRLKRDTMSPRRFSCYAEKNTIDKTNHMICWRYLLSPRHINYYIEIEVFWCSYKLHLTGKRSCWNDKLCQKDISSDSPP